MGKITNNRKSIDGVNHKVRLKSVPGALPEEVEAS